MDYNRVVIERHRENLMIKYLTDKGYYFVIHMEPWVNLKEYGSSNLSDQDIVRLFKSRIDNYFAKFH